MAAAATASRWRRRGYGQQKDGKVDGGGGDNGEADGGGGGGGGLVTGLHPEVFGYLRYIVGRHAGGAGEALAFIARQHGSGGFVTGGLVTGAW